MTSRANADLLILGGGLAGLTVAHEMGSRATVLERNDRPGGLVRTESWDGYWFDHVVHLLHFSDAAIESRVRAIIGPDLAPCPPVAWAESLLGTTRYPFQMNLRGLGADVAARCITDLARVTFGGNGTAPVNFEEKLLSMFGRAMCEAFLFPYNEKQWKRPLTSLPPAALPWTLTRPDFESVLRGALNDEEFATYNTNGWYPRPGPDATHRGMELLTHALAARAHDLRLRHQVERIDLDRHLVYARHEGEPLVIEYGSICSTLPLPITIKACLQAPDALNQACDALPVNRCLTVTVSVEGPRPSAGHWRYYADRSLLFHRVIFMHEFDAGMAPEHGWGLLAEITQPAELPLPDEAALIERVMADLARAGVLNGGRIVDAHVILADPAYVVFTSEASDVVERALAFLRGHGLEPLGRYGRWEYTSMSQVMRSAFDWAAAQA